MKLDTILALSLLWFTVTLAGCVTATATFSEPTFASSAVLRELRDTRPALNALSANEQASLYNALLANCVGAGTPGDPIAKPGKGSEAALIEAFRMGPPVAFLDEMAEARRGEFAAIQAQLAGEDRELFDAALGKQVRAISEESYVSTGIEQTILGYKLAALDGLAAVGTSTSISWLERTTPKLESPDLKRAAERTLDALRGRSKASKS